MKASQFAPNERSQDCIIHSFPISLMLTLVCRCTTRVDRSTNVTSASQSEALNHGGTVQCSTVRGAFGAGARSLPRPLAPRASPPSLCSFLSSRRPGTDAEGRTDGRDAALCVVRPSVACASPLSVVAFAVAFAVAPDPSQSESSSCT